MSEPRDGCIPAARTERLVTEELGEELLIYDLDRDKAHSLNGTVASVWRSCDGVRDVAALTQAVAAQLGEPVGEDAIRRALTQLEERHLLDAALEHRMSGPDFSRRQALVRIGMAGAAAGLAAPVIKSIVAPTPAQAASCALQGESCQSKPCCPGLSCDLTCFGR